jgi:hypothetical protein
MNKFLYIVYKVIRCFYVSMWFYFLPFIVVFASYLIPSTGGDKELEQYASEEL